MGLFAWFFTYKDFVLFCSNVVKILNLLPLWFLEEFIF